MLFLMGAYFDMLLWFTEMEKLIFFNDMRHKSKFLETLKGIEDVRTRNFSVELARQHLQCFSTYWIMFE